jgi:hypothetical protein
MALNIKYNYMLFALVLLFTILCSITWELIVADSFHLFFSNLSIIAIGIFVQWGIPNVIFFYIVNKLHFVNRFFFSLSGILCEVAILLSSYWFIQELISLLPQEVVFSKTDFTFGKRIYFDLPMIVLYSFVFTLLIMLMVSKIIGGFFRKKF